MYAVILLCWLTDTYTVYAHLGEQEHCKIMQEIYSENLPEYSIYTFECIKDRNLDGSKRG